MSPFALEIIDATGENRRQGQALTGALRAALTAALACAPEPIHKGEGGPRSGTFSNERIDEGIAFTQSA